MLSLSVLNVVHYFFPHWLVVLWYLCHLCGMVSDMGLQLQKNPWFNAGAETWKNILNYHTLSFCQFPCPLLLLPVEGGGLPFRVDTFDSTALPLGKNKTKNQIHYIYREEWDNCNCSTHACLVCLLWSKTSQCGDTEMCSAADFVRDISMSCAWCDVWPGGSQNLYWDRTRLRGQRAAASHSKLRACYQCWTAPCNPHYLMYSFSLARWQCSVHSS